MNRVLILLVLLVQGLPNFAYADQTGFDEVCKIYTEVLNSNMSADESGRYIFDNVAQRVQSKEALDAHDVIFQLKPAERYSLFKEAAEHALKKKWECAAMNSLMK